MNKFNIFSIGLFLASIVILIVSICIANKSQTPQDTSQTESVQASVIGAESKDGKGSASSESIETSDESEEQKGSLWYVYDFAYENGFKIYEIDDDQRAVAEAEIYFNWDIRIPFRRFLYAVNRDGIGFNIIRTDEDQGEMLANIRNQISEIKSKQSGITGLTSWHWKDGIVLKGLEKTLADFRRYIAVYYGMR